MYNIIYIYIYIYDINMPMAKEKYIELILDAKYKITNKDDSFFVVK